MNIKIFDRELNDAELFAADRFSYYYDNKRTFAVIGDYAVVVPENNNLSDDEMIEYAKQSMNSVTNTHPDFSSYVMDDGNALIEMNFGVYSVFEGSNVGLSTKDTSVPVGIAIQVRSYCLDAAENGEVLAIVRPT